MTTRVYLARHGSTLLGGEDRFAGETDVPLSEIGRAQARALGARLAVEESMPRTRRPLLALRRQPIWSPGRTGARSS